LKQPRKIPLELREATSVDVNYVGDPAHPESNGDDGFANYAASLGNVQMG
jgi:hypothetical protein